MADRKLKIKIQLVKEGDHYVAFNRDLDISSFGSSRKEAVNAFREMFGLWVEEAGAMGVLDQLISDSGVKAKSAPYGKATSSPISRAGEGRFRRFVKLFPGTFPVRRTKTLEFTY